VPTILPGVKPAPFTYHAPTTVAEALAALADTGGEGKVLAGGQSLIPILNMRLASPAHLIDINGVEGLAGIDVAADAVVVGATVRQADVERHPAVARRCPLLAEALGLVAHPVVRNRGTVVGSLVHADPSAELPAVLALLGGTVRVSAAGDAGGARDIPAEAFFVGPFESAVAAGELAVSVTFPATPASTGTAFTEVARRHGDYAVCGVAAAVELNDERRVRRARVAVLSVAPAPLVLDVTEPVDGRTAKRANYGMAARLVHDQVVPEGDIHASAEYRRHLAGVLSGRALRRAAARAVDRVTEDAVEGRSQ
jgi:aerobic carbon-monoxide dehydrogenase medium subunit